ncbi:MAG: pyrroloquinoline quinone biosynthesis protein PqqC [Alphaproteobacteria bacterium]|nr:pyrroloquinoline quinone biosynthesis protein PqqC [Alphaproteobacteria bacterium]
MSNDSRTQITRLLSPAELEAALRDIGAQRYHNRHPFHQLLHAGKLSKGQLQAWALNRFYYQSRIPMKDAGLMSRTSDPDLRREWIRRISDHDGAGPDTGGIERWLRLTSGLGLDTEYVMSETGILAATKFAVDAYVRYVREQSLLQAVASSLTELFAATLIQERVAAMLANYAYVDKKILSYFDARLTQAPQDSSFALAYCQKHAVTVAQQQDVLDALYFKCDVLWAQLDALHGAYVSPGHVPPGAFIPGTDNK